jgi:hypothetical protein
MDKIMWYQTDVDKEELPENGMVLCTGADCVMDLDYWPLWMLRLLNGIVVESYTVFSTENSRPAEKMVGFTRQDIANWSVYTDSNVDERHYVLSTIDRVNNSIPWKSGYGERVHIANK